MPDSPRDTRSIPAAHPRAPVRLFALSLTTLLAACATDPGVVSRSQALDDYVINTRVKEAVFADVALKETVIEVSTRNGQVRLAGLVANAGDAARAADFARRVPGVKGLSNELKIGRP